LKERDLSDDPRTSTVQSDTGRNQEETKSWQQCGNKIETEDFPSIDPYEMETMLEEDIYPSLKYCYSKRQ
jgi:hypothetical protein